MDSEIIFPPQQEGRFYLTEGGTETEIMYKHRIRGIRPNASKMEKIALCQIGHLEDGDPVELGKLCGDLAKRYPHMDIWGECCGTWNVHLDEIAKNVLAA